MNLKLVALVTLISACGATAADRALFAAESPAGQKLHDANCLGCHDARIYSGEKRSIRSLDDLRDQIGACGHNTGKRLSAREVEEIAGYLNARYYRFP